MTEEEQRQYIRDNSFKSSHIHHLNTLLAKMLDISNGYGTIEIVVEGGQPKIMRMTVHTKQGHQYS